MALIVITGPPASGKSTWVLARATSHDIVIDFDRLATALTGTGADSHDHAGPVHAVTRKAREAAITAAVPAADHTDVYVIHSTPSSARMAWYARCGARFVTIDPGRDIVLARCSGQRPRRMRLAAQRWYEDRDAGRGDVTERELTPGATSRDW